MSGIEVPKTVGEAAKLFREHAVCLRRLTGPENSGSCRSADRFDARAELLEDFFEDPNTPLSEKYNREWDWPVWVKYHGKVKNNAIP